MNRALGWAEPQTYGRTHRGRATAPLSLDGIPTHVRLPVPPAIYDQGGVGSCVAQALALACETLAPRSGYLPERPDRVALYARTRRALGTLDRDSGALIADGVEVLREGWEREERDPPDEWAAIYAFPPRPQSFDAPRVVSSEALAHDVDTVVWELLCGHPVVVGLRITEQWATPAERIGPPEGEIVGGHAVCLVGYQREADRIELRARNSWGALWGFRGEVWLDPAWLGLNACGELHALRAIRRSR